MSQTPMDDRRDEPVVEFRELSLSYGKTIGIDRLTLALPPRQLIGLIGPDGVGKSTLLSLITGAHVMQKGDLRVLGGDMRDAEHRNWACPRIAYMPQGLGKNLYFTLTVEENLQFFARLFGQDAEERRQRIDRLTKSTGLYRFLNRPAGKLSGGMKQKLGLCCSLIHDPDLLVLDEPTTGVDPLARRQFWDLIDNIKEEQPSLSVIVATAYMDEAQRFDWLIAMDEGHILDTGTPEELLKKTSSPNLDEAFIKLLPEEKRSGHSELVVPPLETDGEISIEAEGLTKRFGDFTAVDHVSFKIQRGEIFGFLGSNGCGKTTTMRMLTGLLPVTEGVAKLFGKPIDSESPETRKNLGYMTQLFSLYNELTVRQNIELYAKLYDMEPEEIPARVDAMLERFDLTGVANRLPSQLPLGIKQRMSLAAAVIHSPQILILDEPTSGVDPVARDSFWELIIEISRRDKVTVFITTHFMNEATRCDRISLMHAGRSLACDTPEALTAARSAETLEDAFIAYLEEADSGAADAAEAAAGGMVSSSNDGTKKKKSFFQEHVFDFGRFYTYFWRELLELRRDRIRTTLALFGALILMVVIGYGITMDVENIDTAVLDWDQSELSQDYLLSIYGSPRYFRVHEPVTGHSELETRMKSGELQMVVEIPPSFGRDVQRGKNPDVGYWIDGGEPGTAETTVGYAQGVHSLWQQRYTERQQHGGAKGVSVQNRYLYNPDVLSLPAMVPAVIPLLLMMIPAVLAALSVVREKELGSIINLYVTPVRRSEFLLGKQLPYVLFSFTSAVLLVLMAVFLFNVPIKGSVLLLMGSLFIYCILSTGMGMLCSSVTKSQIAVIFLALIATMMPAVQLCGLTDPVPNDGSLSSIIGNIYPTTHMLLISRGVFNKGLRFTHLTIPVLILAVEIVAICGLGILTQRKQER
ncbi:MAG: ribosome-associated ATPase/putative transporter RbbA [Lentisphaerae bacterium]|jgi:ribosome-dependent ATPase|nr:ribosome-associated ATPase/putative transporter RbbA [Lentisphaerota bacterium]